MKFAGLADDAGGHCLGDRVALLSGWPQEMWAPIARLSVLTKGHHVRACIVSTYPPRPCGIATFARDLTEALRAADPIVDIDVVAIVRETSAELDPDVLAAIRQDAVDDYVGLAMLLDNRGVDVVLIEHEFGIYGGDAGSHLLSLVRNLRQPYVLTLHTVLAQPSAEQAETLRELCARATFVTVFTETARRMMLDARLAEADICESFRTALRLNSFRKTVPKSTRPSHLPIEQSFRRSG